jgi:hypothetical protein
VEPPDSKTWPLSSYFLSGYLSANKKDSENFPPDEVPAVFHNYEALFHSARHILRITKKTLKSRPEFDFDSGDANNLESGIAILRVVVHLKQAGFSAISLVMPKKGSGGADLTAERGGNKVCFEVKTITKQSSGREAYSLADQLYEKILENLPKARRQLEASAVALQCTLKVFVCVVNWFAQSIHLSQDNYQDIVNKLEKNEDQESLLEVDGVWFVTQMGQTYGFLNERGKSLDH